MGTEKKCLLVFDGNALVHRAYHALPPLSTKNGELVNAVYGFFLVFFKAIQEFCPEYVTVSFDIKGPTFRHKQFAAYKAKRPATPEELSRQLPIVKRILSAFNIAIYEKKGFEADDIIGTISRLAPKKQTKKQTASAADLETVIISGDLDVLQLVDKQTKALIFRKGVKETVLYDENSVSIKYQGLRPKQLIDFKALRGDPSDNIPGVTGIGEKTAIELVKEFGSLENIYNILESDKEILTEIKPKIKEMLSQQKEQAFLSKALAAINQKVPIDFNLEKCRWNSYNKEEAARILAEFEFYSLIKKLPELGKQKEKKGNLRLL